MERVVVVANPRAGRGRARVLAAGVATEATRRGWAAEVVVPETIEAMRATVAEVVADGVDRVVCIGGDGAAHHAVQEVAGTEVVLGLVPCGTGNDWALGLGIARTSDAVAAADAALAPARAVDALRTDHGWVASLATVGFSADVNDRADRLRWPRGSARYTLATLLSLPGLAPVPLVLGIDGVEQELEATLLAFGTTSCFGGAMAVCPSADPTDGRSDVTTIGPVGRFDLLRTFPKVFRGTHVTHPAVRTATGVELTLRSDRPVVVRADGEVLGTLPLRATTVAGAIHVAGADPARIRFGRRGVTLR